MLFHFPWHLCQADMCVMFNEASTVAGITIYKWFILNKCSKKEHHAHNYFNNSFYWPFWVQGMAKSKHGKVMGNQQQRE